MRPSFEKPALSSHATARPAIALVRVLLALCALAIARDAHAADAGGPRPVPRFGDSTWVAPAWPLDSLTATAGSRIAPPDRERGWETALRMPFRVAFLPLRAVSLGVEKASDVVAPHLINEQLNTSQAAPVGLAIAPQVRVGALRDVGLGPALTWHAFPGPNDNLYVTGTLSTLDRRTAEVRQTFGRHEPWGLVLRAAYDYKPNRRFYGIGNDAPRSDSSIYLLSTTSLGATLLHGSAPWRQARLFAGYSSMSPRRGYFDTPRLEDVFTPAQAPFEHRTTQELLAGVGADLATLDDALDPSRGLHGRFDAERDFGARARDPDFDRWRAELRGYLPVLAPRRVLALRAVYAGVDPRGSTTALPYYRLATNDGADALAGYPNHRFADRRFALARLEYRWIVVYRVSAVALYERVQVAPSASAFAWRDAHATWGGGLRYAMSERSVARVELGKSHDGLEASLRLGSDW